MLDELNNYYSSMTSQTKLQYEALVEKVGKKTKMPSSTWKEIERLCAMLVDTHEAETIDDPTPSQEQYLGIVGAFTKNDIINGSYYTLDQVYDENGMNGRMEALLFPSNKYSYCPRGHIVNSEIDCA